MPPSTETHTLKVLLIEDNPGDVRLIKEIVSDIKEPRIELICADRLAAGLEQVAKGKVDAVLLDLSLPDSPWYETAKKINAHSMHAPVIILTGMNDPSLPVQTIRHGAQDYLVKGQFDPAAFQRAITYAIERHKRHKTPSPKGKAEPKAESSANLEAEVCGFRIDPFQRKVWYKS